MRFLRRLLLLPLALVFLAEAWLWDVLAETGRRLSDLPALRVAGERLASFVRRLPPYPALAVFAVPALVIAPFKFVGLFFFAKGHFIVGAAIFMAAKIVGFGLTALLFGLTRDSLLTLRWFSTLYRVVNDLRQRAHQLVDPYLAPIRAAAASARAVARAWLGDRRSRTMRLMTRLRTQVRRSRT